MFLFPDSTTNTHICRIYFTKIGLLYIMFYNLLPLPSKLYQILPSVLGPRDGPQPRLADYREVGGLNVPLFSHFSASEWHRLEKQFQDLEGLPELCRKCGAV